MICNVHVPYSQTRPLPETPDSFYALVDFRTSKALWRTRQTPLVWRRVNRQRRKAIAPPGD
jgi:hypothetical protein